MNFVVKIGGSLFPDDAIRLCSTLVGREVLVICGAGALAEKIREYDKRLNFSDTTAHKTAILCMDIVGMLVADKIEDAMTTYSIEDAKKALRDSKLPVLLPSKLLQYLDPLNHSWRVTSDSISFYIAYLLSAKLLIATDVDGIYSSDPSSDDAKLIKNISAKKLLSFDRTSVDEVLPELLLKYKSDCYVVNGKYPERVISIMEGRDSKYTFIGGN